MEEESTRTGEEPRQEARHHGQLSAFIGIPLDQALARIVAHGRDIRTGRQWSGRRANAIQIVLTRRLHPRIRMKTAFYLLVRQGGIDFEAFHAASEETPPE